MATEQSEQGQTSKINEITNLQGYLEEYVKQEGLYDIIPEYRRPKLFNLSNMIVFVWFIWLWGGSSYFGFINKSVGGILIGTLAPIVSSVIVVVGLAVYFTIQQFRLKRKVINEGAQVIGFVFLIILPIFTAFGLGYYLVNFWTTIWSVALH